MESPASVTKVKGPEWRGNMAAFLLANAGASAPASGKGVSPTKSNGEQLFPNRVWWQIAVSHASQMNQILIS